MVQPHPCEYPSTLFIYEIPRNQVTYAAGSAPELPFFPFDVALRDILRQKYLRNVAEWLMGRDENSVLAMAGNSAWEAALTVRFLADFSDILAEAGEDSELREEIRKRIVTVARWLLERRTELPGDLVSWENVTWDTCVAVRALMIVLQRHPEEFSLADQATIEGALTCSSKWLAIRFSQWEKEVKYPFGPADVAQIVIALLHLAEDFPALYAKISTESGGILSPRLESEIIQYLLHCKTEKTLTIETPDGSKDLITYWWADFFSTAEVVEAMALFYARFTADEALKAEWAPLLHAVHVALIRACAHFEQGQDDGMWGSHIETIKVIYAYVLIRRQIPQRAPGVDAPLIVPEIHTTFKALRWMCDEKQIFPDGSFLHTMFLTIFYALALVEVYRSWDPVWDTVADIYDDVVWFSPIRTTPERSQRLAAQLDNAELRSTLEDGRTELASAHRAACLARRTHRRSLSTAVVLLVGLFVTLLIGSLTGVGRIGFRVASLSDYLEFLAIAGSMIFGAIALIWKWDEIVGHGNDE